MSDLIYSSLEVHALYHGKGVLSTQKDKDFEIVYEGRDYRILIEQSVVRRVNIACGAMDHAKTINSFLQEIEYILMMFDGKFLSLKELEYLGEAEELGKYKQLKDDYINNRLRLFDSDDICQYTNMKLIDYQDVDFSEIFPKWCKIRAELRLVHPMYLYMLSDSGIPVDCKCAHLIQIFEPLAELVELYKKDYKAPVARRNTKESTLKLRWESLIKMFGEVIFDHEKDDISELMEKFRSMRNTIMHISSKWINNCLSSKECILYRAKISLLYRHIIFELLGIPYEIYKANLEKVVNDWDDWFLNS